MTTKRKEETQVVYPCCCKLRTLRRSLLYIYVCLDCGRVACCGVVRRFSLLSDSPPSNLEVSMNKREPTTIFDEVVNSACFASSCFAGCFRSTVYPLRGATLSSKVLLLQILFCSTAIRCLVVLKRGDTLRANIKTKRVRITSTLVIVGSNGRRRPISFMTYTPRNTRARSITHCLQTWTPTKSSISQL